MRRVSIEFAEAQLDDLIDAALAGEDIKIAKADQSAVRLVPVKRAEFKIGILKGKIGNVPDFIKPDGAV